MKIVVLDGYTLNPGDLSWDGFSRLGELTVYDRTPFENEEIIKRIDGADIIITNKTPMSRQILDSCKTAKYIGVLATGYNVVDIVCAKEKGIPVTNIPAYGTDAVAQFAIALLLEVCHRIGHHNEAVHRGRWTESIDFCFWDTPQIELAGKTIGIIGFGRIGRCTGTIASALKMNVLAYDKHESESGKAIARYVSLDELLESSDVICLHCPLLPETEGIINSRTISKMKDGAIIINNSRGPLIVENDLAEALNNGKIAAAGLDVVSTEPITEDNPLLAAKNCIITPHISWASYESRLRLMDIAVKNLESFLSGDPQNVIND
jgi:glycerate dehydrogenase